MQARARRRAPRRARSPTAGGRVARTAVAPLRPARRPRPPPRAGEEQLDAVGVVQARDGIDVLAGELEALARGDEERDARARLPEPRDLDRDAGQEVLAVVDHEQAPLAGERRSDRIHRRLVGLDTERPGERRRDEVRIAQRCERLPREPVGELLGGLGRRLEREAGLAAAAGAGEGDQPGPTREQPRDLRDLGAPADEGRGGDGEVRTMDRPQRREVPLSELVQADRLGEVLQPLLAEVVQGKRRGPEDTCGRGGEDDLPSVARLRRYAPHGARPGRCTSPRRGAARPCAARPGRGAGPRRALRGSVVPPRPRRARRRTRRGTSRPACRPRPLRAGRGLRG